MYVKSDKIKFYPSAYRYYMDNGVSVVTDEEASKNTEYNITSHIAKIFHSTKGSFVVSDNNDTDLEFYIGGYYVKIEDVATNLFSGFSSDLDIYANIKLALVTPPPTQGNWDNLYEVVEFENEYKPLDYQVSSDVVFEGISFETSANANATYSLHLYTRGSTMDLFRLVTLSTYSLKLSDIIGNLTTGVGADSEIKTGSLIATGFLYVGTNGSCITTSNNGDFVLNRNILFDNGSYQIGDSNNFVMTIYSDEVVIGHGIFTRAGGEDIGTSSSKFGSVYANNFYGDLEGAQATLSSALLPKTNDGANIGASNRKFANIYASNFYGNQLTLSSALTVSASTVDLGGNANRIRTVYAKDIRGNECHINSLDTDGNSNITLKDDLIPDSPAAYLLGDNTFPMYDVNSVWFHGTLIGNADTASAFKFTGSQATDGVGSSTNPVYFQSNGKPYASSFNSNFYNSYAELTRFDRVKIMSDNTNPIYGNMGDGYIRNCLIQVLTNTFVTMTFVRSSSATNSTTFRANNITFRLHFLDDMWGDTEITLQHLDGSTWKKASELIQTAFILQLGRIN